MKLAKKLSVVFMAAALAAAPVAGTFVEPTAIVEAKEATISATDLDLFVGTEAKLKVSGAKKVKWSSSDDSVASVSKKGVVTGNRAGSAVITAKAGKSEFTVTVYVYDLTIALDHATLDLYQGETHELDVLLTAVGRPVVWTSSDDSVATVEEGVVTAVAPGTATITATLKEGLEATCAVTVKEAAEFDFDDKKFGYNQNCFWYYGELDDEAEYYLDGELLEGEIWLDPEDDNSANIYWNKTPLYAGDHILEIKKDGYKTYTYEFNLPLVYEDYAFIAGDGSLVVALNQVANEKNTTIYLDGEVLPGVKYFENGDGRWVACASDVKLTGTHTVTISVEGYDDVTIEVSKFD